MSETKQERFQSKITSLSGNNRPTPYSNSVKTKVNSQTSNISDNLQSVTNPSTSHESSNLTLVSEAGLSKAERSKKIKECASKLTDFFKEIRLNKLYKAIDLEIEIKKLCSQLDKKHNNALLAKLYFGKALICVNSNKSEYLKNIIGKMNTLKKENEFIPNLNLSTVFRLNIYLVHVFLLNKNYTDAINLACELLNYTSNRISSIDKQDLQQKPLMRSATRVYVISYCLLAVCYHKENDPIGCRYALEYITEYINNTVDTDLKNKVLIKKTSSYIEQNNTDKLLRYDLINFY